MRTFILQPRIEASLPNYPDAGYVSAWQGPTPPNRPGLPDGRVNQRIHRRRTGNLPAGWVIGRIARSGSRLGQPWRGSFDPLDGVNRLRTVFARQHAGIGAGECGVEALIGLNDRPSGSQMKGSGGVLRGPGSRGSYDTLQDGTRARLVTMAQQDAELVSTQAGHEITIARRVPKNRGCAAEQPVTECVAQRVIRLLQPVDVDSQEGVGVPLDSAAAIASSQSNRLPSAVRESVRASRW